MVLWRLMLKRVWIPVSLLVLFMVYAITVNWHGLCEGIGYLVDGLVYESAARHPIRKTGEFGLAHKLVSLSSHERMEAIKRTLTAYGVHFEAIPVADGFENIFVPGKLADGFFLIEAHYDKAVDEPAFQAATDNTGSVVVLLAAIKALKDELTARPVAFLFTALEESGLSGAFSFVEYASHRGHHIQAALCLDMIGRGRPIVMTSASSAGFCFHIPFYKSMLYNGRKFTNAPDRWPLHKPLLDIYFPNCIRTYKAFVSYPILTPSHPCDRPRRAI